MVVGGSGWREKRREVLLCKKALGMNEGGSPDMEKGGGKTKSAFKDQSLHRTQKAPEKGMKRGVCTNRGVYLDA